MFFKNSEIPNNFNRIADISDNYIVWVKENKLNNNTDYDAYIQYIKPSTYYIFVDNYRITKGDVYTLNANYITSGMYNYLDSYDVDYSFNTLQVDEDYITYEDSERSDSVDILFGQILCVVAILWVFKQISRLFSKGGLY